MLIRRARGNERRALLSDETVAIIRRLRPDVCPGDGERECECVRALRLCAYLLVKERQATLKRRERDDALGKSRKNIIAARATMHREYMSSSGDVARN